MGLEEVQETYKLPRLKRGMVVTCGDEQFFITGTPRNSSTHINVRDGDGYRYTFHPFDLAYWIDDGTIVRGKVR